MKDRPMTEKERDEAIEQVSKTVLITVVIVMLPFVIQLLANIF